MLRRAGCKPFLFMKHPNGLLISHDDKLRLTDLLPAESLALAGELAHGKWVLHQYRGL
jgi:hypothetical protein